MSYLLCFLPQPRHLMNIVSKLCPGVYVECWVCQAELFSDGTTGHPGFQFINSGGY
jgi:hypothetical protein